MQRGVLDHLDFLVQIEEIDGGLEIGVQFESPLVTISHCRVVVVAVSAIAVVVAVAIVVVGMCVCSIFCPCPCPRPCPCLLPLRHWRSLTVILTAEVQLHVSIVINHLTTIGG